MKAPDPLPEGDQWKCGAGKEAECCRYLIMSTDGFHCARDNYESMALGLSMKPKDAMVSQRLPTEEYPHCQLRLQ